MTINICVFGTSGIGKTDFGKIFCEDKVSVVEPYRARTKGARENEKYYINPEILTELLYLNRLESSERLEFRDSDQGTDEPYVTEEHTYRKWLEIYPRISFFMVRDTAQLLLHKEVGPQSRKLEIFAPVLVQMLNNENALRIMPYFNEVTTVFVHLNPLKDFIRDIDLKKKRITEYPFANKKWNWKKIQVERNKLKKGNKLIGDVNTRLDFLPIEAEAWQSLAQFTEGNFKFVDCNEWPYFECECLRGNCKLTDIKKFFLKCVKKQAPNIYGDLNSLLRI